MQAQAGERNDVKGIAMRIGLIRFGEMNDVGRIRNKRRNGNHNLGGIIFYYQMGSKKRNHRSILENYSQQSKR